MIANLQILSEAIVKLTNKKVFINDRIIYIANSIDSMKRLIQIVVLIIIATLLFAYFIRNNERVNIDTASVYVKKTGSKYELYRNGKPFYIQGASGDSYMEELKNAGANTFRVYDTVNIKKTLDKAQKLDLAVIVDLMLPRFKGSEEYYANSKTRQQLKSNILSFVRKNKDHPSLLMWNFNEIEYPYKRKHQYFRTLFNSIVDEIHEIDSNHPVCTSVAGTNKRQFVSLKIGCPQLDIISINVFRNLAEIENEFNKISLVWDGAYFISEWGINGPWEESKNTSWGVPIEITSTEKARQLKDRYEKFIPNKENERCLGNMAFFWGQKQERTHTWFSMYSDKGERTKILQELEFIWNGSLPVNNAPDIGAVKIDNKTAENSILLNAGSEALANVSYHDIDNDSLTINWELYPENWAYLLGDIENKPNKILNAMIEIKDNKVVFKVPEDEGAYRLFSYVYDNKGNFATSNIPFYVLKSDK